MCGSTGALIPASCNFLVAGVSVVEYGEHYTPRVDNGGWSGSLQDWWNKLATEPGSNISNDSGRIFALPYPLDSRGIVLVPSHSARAFQRFQARLSIVYSSLL